MYLRSFLCEEAKIKQRTPLKKELCEIGEEAIWESWFPSFFSLVDKETGRSKIADKDNSFVVKNWQKLQ